MPKKIQYLFFFVFTALHSIGQEINFTYNNHCINNLIYFEDLSNLGIEEPIAWYWEFGDNGISTDQNPVYAFANPGKYNVKLTIKTITEKEYSAEKTIEIKSSPFAFFNPNELCNKTVEFKDNTFSQNAEIKMWMWDFGDGGYSMTQNPMYRFNNKDQSKVKLQVRNEFGCWDSISQTINTVDNPRAGFDINQVIISNPTIIKITSHNTKDSVFYLLNEKLINNKNALIKAPKNSRSTLKQKVIGENGCIDSVETKIHPQNDYFIDMPAHFSPKSQGAENEFGIKIKDIIIESFTIYTPTGQVVYKTNNNRPWNGQVNNKGVIPEQGIYNYELKFINQQSITIIQEGKFHFCP